MPALGRSLGDEDGALGNEITPKSSYPCSIMQGHQAIPNKIIVSVINS